MVMAPIVRGRKGEFKKDLEKLARQGFVRARMDGVLRSLDEEIVLDKRRNHTIEVVVDRLLVKPGIEKRLEASIETATKLADGLVLIAVVDGEERLYSQKLACIECGDERARNWSRDRSPSTVRMARARNAPGLEARGHSIPKRSLWILEAAARRRAGAGRGFEPAMRQRCRSRGEALGSSSRRRARNCPRSARRNLLKAAGGVSRHSEHSAGNLRSARKITANGSPNTCRRCRAPLAMESVCGPSSLAVRVRNLSIAEFTAMPISRALLTARSWEFQSAKGRSPGGLWTKSAAGWNSWNPWACITSVWIAAAATLSGGEAQRIRLATQIGSKLRGVLYVLDEPSIGLHPRDNDRLLETLKQLRDMGNTVLVVEHDAETIERADYVIDLGPGAGRLGGELVASGTPEARSEKSQNR